MGDELPPSVKFLQSEGTDEDFREYWKADPIGAAQYAAGLAQANKQRFDGLEELQAMLKHLDDPQASIEEEKQKLLQFAVRQKSVFQFVERSEAVLRSRDETLGWSTN